MVESADELKLLEICLKTNLKMLQIADTVNIKDRTGMLLGITMELKKLCDKIIPELEKEYNNL